MGERSTYSGWSSYATWRVNLEIIDDLVNSWDEDDNPGPFNDVWELSRQLKDEAEQAVSGFGELDNNPYADLALSFAMSFLDDVDWDEIAESIITEHPYLIAGDEEEEEEEEEDRD